MCKNNNFTLPTLRFPYKNKMIKIRGSLDFVYIHVICIKNPLGMVESIVRIAHSLYKYFADK
jgi:hypothetical protein